MVSEAMKNAGYEIIPVNPQVEEVLGMKAVATLKDIEGHIDIVNVFRRSEFCQISRRNLRKLMQMYFGRNLE